ncbi:uncharacterized protein PG986_010646 [Apiospora aurea]|uniref:Uncharacterized protein n=1 Tax=Apiospora aurea TaxID=335848 RepID=A0ABR1Q2W2_9PEZI
MGGSDNDSLELTDFLLGAFGAALTLLNLIALYADMVATIRQAPKQMREAFGNVRQQLSEEREALTHQMRQSRLTQEQQRKLHEAASKRDIANGSGNGGGVVLLPLTYTDETLLLHYNTLKNLWVQFKELEQPFLLPLDEVHLAESAAYQLDRDDSWNTEHFRAARLDPPHKSHGTKKTKNYDHKHEFLGPEALESLYQCSFVHRFIWWRTKPDVKRLGEKVVKIMLRRMEREVTQTRLMVMQSRGMDFKYDGLFYENAAFGGAGHEHEHGDEHDDARTAAAAAVEADHRRMAHRRSSRRGTAAVPTTSGAAAAADGERMVWPRRASSAGPGPAIIRDDRIYRQRESVDRGRGYYVTRQEAARRWGPRGAIRHSRSRSPRRS